MAEEAIEENVLQYVRTAESMGVDTSSPFVMHQLVNAIRYVDARMKARRAGNNFLSEMEQITGIKADMLVLWGKSPYVGIATKIISEKLISEIMESDVRKNIVDVYSQDSLDWFKNMSRIAKGVKAPGAKMPPLERDQIDAFEALTVSEMGQVYTRMLFLEPEDRDVTPQDLHLARQRELRASAVKIEANIIEGEIKELPSPETPAALHSSLT